MATTVTFYCYQRKANSAKVTEVSGTLSLNDVSVNTTTTVSSGAATWNTATVTADKQTQIYVTAANATTAGIDEGWYISDGRTASPKTFRKQHSRVL